MNEHKAKPLIPSRFDMKNHVNNTFQATLEEGTTREDLLDPRYWSSVAHQLKPFDEIRVMYQYSDTTWIAEYIVLDAGKNYAKVVEKKGSYQEMEDDDIPGGMDLSGYSVKWVNIHVRWRVIRNEDKSTVKENLPTKKDAWDWLEQNIQNLRRDAA